VIVDPGNDGQEQAAHHGTGKLACRKSDACFTWSDETRGAVGVGDAERHQDGRNGQQQTGFPTQVAIS